MPKRNSTFADSRVPLYYQLENMLREKITSGKFEDGEQLPTELELIKEYGVSRITVRQALKSLADDGLIERKQGRGTYIAERRTRKQDFSGTIHLNGSLDELIELGLGTPVKLIEMNLIEASNHEAELLHLSPGDSIYRIKRLRTLYDTPYALMVNYLPERIGSKLSEEDVSSGALLHKIEKRPRPQIVHGASGNKSCIGRSLYFRIARRENRFAATID